MDALHAYLEKNKDRFLEELFELLKIPSVSADPAFKDDVFEAAEFVRSRLEEAGAENTEVCPTEGYPIVYGEKMVDESAPTVLVYGHYDVQPADPYELWETPPFEPVIRNGAIYARGSSDDKGQMYMHIKALELMLATDVLKCNVKFMIEGEEEVGSASLGQFVKDNKERLAADVVLISDTALISMEHPSITVGLRGLSYMEVKVTGPNRDLHSGIYGGAVANPANVLSEMIAQLKDDDKRIRIPGFYDRVDELSAEERAAMAEIPFDLEAFKSELGIPDVEGEKGYSTIERTSIRPALDVNGIWGGYTGEGAKTVIPSEASAKISMRLVPHQRSEEISALFEKYIKSVAPPSVRVEVSSLHGGEPVVTPVDSVAYRAASKAMESTFGKKPIPYRSGGSIPIVPMFEELLGLKSILMGFGLDTDAIHSPNEHFGLINFFKGIETIPYFYRYYAEMHGRSK